MFIDFYNKEDSPENHITHYISLVIWYLVFIIMIPVTLRSLYGFNILRYYFPIIDLIANSFTTSGSDRLFKNLYRLSPNNLLSFLSTNFINLLALLGVSWNGILYAREYNNIWIGVYVTLLMYIITYLIPTQGIPFFIKKFQDNFSNYVPDGWIIRVMGVDIHLEDYLGAFVIIVCLMLMETLLITFYIRSLQ